MNSKIVFPVIALLSVSVITACNWQLNSKNKRVSVTEPAKSADGVVQSYATNTQPSVAEAPQASAKEPQAQQVAAKKSPGEMAFQSFKNEFKARNLPLTVGRKTVKQIDQNKEIKYQYAKYIPAIKSAKFSRGGGEDFYYFARVEENSEYTAVIYAMSNSIMAEQTPVEYILATYTNAGKLIDKKTIGGQNWLDQPFLVCNIKPGMELEIKSYKDVYEKDIAGNGYENNKLLRSELQFTHNYKITEKGKFVATDHEVALNK